MYSNMSNNSIIDSDKAINDLKELLDKFIEKFSNLKIKKEDSVENLVKKYSADEEFQKKLKIINCLMNDISDKLEALDSFENEFHNFLSIQNMIRYITRNIEKYISYSTFVKELTSSFCELINAKIRLTKNEEFEKYDRIYKSFDDYLFKHEEFFYLTIYESSHKYDDLIRKVNNILW